MDITIGAELEGVALDGYGHFADTLKALEGGYKSSEYPFETLTSDVAFCSVEATTTPCTDACAVGTSLRRCLSHMPEHLTLHFRPQTLYDGDIPIAKKVRYGVMAEALSREHPQGYNGMLQVAPWNATHFHTGVVSVLSHESVVLLNVLNHIAPFARLQAIERFRVIGAAGHLAIWTRFTKPERLPAPRWFPDADSMVALVESIPKLFVKTGDDEWKVGEGEMSKLGDAVSEGVLWWLARPRMSYGTLEWRPFPSLRPEHVEELAGEMFRLLEAFYGFLAAHPGLYGRPDGRDVGALLSHLSTVSWLVPRRVLNDDEWWQLFHR